MKRAYMFRKRICSASADDYTKLDLRCYIKEMGQDATAYRHEKAARSIQ